MAAGIGVGSSNVAAGGEHLFLTGQRMDDAMVAFRQEVRSLIGPTADPDGQGVPAAAVDIALEEAHRLMEELQLTVAVSNEFRWKWAKQKQQIISSKQAEIDKALRHKCEAAAQRTQAATNEELVAIVKDAAGRCSEAAQALASRHADQLREHLAEWRRGEPEAERVRPAATEEAVKGAVQRIASWSEEEERHQLQRWEEDLASLANSAHQLDKELLSATTSMHSARRTALRAALEQQEKEFSLQHCEAQAGIDEDIRVALENSKADISGVGHNRKIGYSLRRAPAKSSILAKLERQRCTVALKEAQAAAEAHKQMALQQVDDFAAREHEHLFAFHTAMNEVIPELTRDFEHEIQLRCEESQDADLESTLLPSDDALLGPARPSAAASRGLLGRLRPDAPAGSTLSLSDSEPESQDEHLDRPHGARRLLGEVAQLRGELDAAETALSRGAWGEGWRNRLETLSQDGASLLQAAEEAFEAQSQVLDGARFSLQDPGYLEQRVGEHVAVLRHELARMRNLKVALSRARAHFLRDVAQQQHSAMLRYEDEILTAVSRLAKETETLVEIGFALKHGSETAPVGIACGALRRATCAALPLLAHAWQETDTPLHDQLHVLARLYDRLARAPGLGRVLDNVVA